MGSNAGVVLPARSDESLGRSKRRACRASAPLIAIALLAGALGVSPAAADKGDVTAGAVKAEVILRKGDRGPAVAVVQRRLRLKADGIFGPQTHRSVSRFQRRRDLVADGIVGPVTRKALRLRPFSYKSVFRPREGKRRGGGAGGGGLPNLPDALVRIAECESGGDPTAVSADGRYYGKYQFLRSTWKTWGGRGSDPAAATEEHQDRVAVRLYRARGTAPWPNCG